MSEDDWVAHWTNLASTLYLMYGFDRPHLPTDQLDALEQCIHLRLPASYRAFIRTFGPGRLAEAFTIYAPGYPDAPVVDFHSADGWQEHLAKERNNPFINRLVAFGDYLGHRGLFAWDREQQNSESGEYPIYFVPRHDDEPVILVTDSFAKWVEEEALNSTFYPRIGVKVTDEMLTWVDDDTGELRSHRCFDPIG